MAYRITFETEDGTVEDYMTETTKTAAEKIARNAARSSALNEPMNVTRWFVEKDWMTISTFGVAA